MLEDGQSGKPTAQPLVGMPHYCVSQVPLTRFLSNEANMAFILPNRRNILVSPLSCAGRRTCGRIRTLSGQSASLRPTATPHLRGGGQATDLKLKAALYTPMRYVCFPLLRHNVYIITMAYITTSYNRDLDVAS